MQQAERQEDGIGQGAQEERPPGNLKRRSPVQSALRFWPWGPLGMVAFSHKRGRTGNVPKSKTLAVHWRSNMGASRIPNPVGKCE